MSKAWQLQEAKNRLSEVMNSALSNGPQIITRRGEETVVVLSMKDFKKITKPKSSLADFFKKSPLFGVDFSSERSRNFSRKIDL